MTKLGYTKENAVFGVSEVNEKANEITREPKTFTLFVWKNFA
jgi:hypothetical protein